jgi:hypothetical protein
MAKKSAGPQLTSSQVVAVGLLRKAMADSGLSRDKLPMATLRKLSDEFNKTTGESLSPDEYRDLAIRVDKKGTAKIEQALKSLGLSVQPKR